MKAHRLDAAPATARMDKIVLGLFRQGFDTNRIAVLLRRAESEVYNALARARR